MTLLAEDLRYGLRMLRKNPGFTSVVILTLALGIGANTAMFSVVNGVLLDPLPYPQPEQLVALHESKPNFERGSISIPNFLDWKKENHSFAAMAVARGTGFTLAGSGQAEQIPGDFVSGDFFRLLDVNPVIGRTFTSDEDQLGRPRVALLGEAFWRRRFGAAPDVLGKNLTLDGGEYMILGVIPASFDLQIPGFNKADIYVPITQWTNSLLMKRNAGLGVHGLGRLKPGVSIEQARADMQRVTSNLAAAYPNDDIGIGATLIPLKQQLVGRMQSFLLVLLAAVGFVLLIACVNVANLMLARSTARTREFAIRTALGAGRRRLVRQLLTESLLLALAGGGLGLMVAAWGTEAALGALPSALPRAHEVGLNPRVLMFTAVVSLLAGIFFGLAPALKSTASGLHETLKQGGRGSSGLRPRLQNVFVVVEMALALVLLTGAGLMIRSLVGLWSVDPGFNPHNILNFSLSLAPSMSKVEPAAIRAGLREFDNKIRAIPGIQAVSLSWGAMPMNGDDERLFWIEGRPKPASDNDMNWALAYIVEADYLQTMQIPLLRGRFLSTQDTERTQAVAVVDDSLANKFFPRQNPIGQRINLKDYAAPVEIVGVVGHVKQWGLDSDDTQALRAQLYLSLMQLPDQPLRQAVGGLNVLVRSQGRSPGLFDSIQRTSGRMNAQQVVYGPQTMDQIISISLGPRRFSMILLGAFAAFALALASIGIFGVTSYVVGQQTREIAVRMALGAQPREILRLVLASGGSLAIAGIGGGLVLAFGLTRLMKSLLYGVRPTDPLTFAAVAVLLLTIALAACYLPARHASRVDPMLALRFE